MHPVSVPTPAAAVAPADSASPPAAPVSPAPRPVRVLVVEDSAPNRKLLCALLTRLKCAATPAEHGQQCVDLLRPHFTAPAERAAAAAANAKFAAVTPSAAQFVAVGAQAESRPALPPPLPFDIVLMVRRAIRAHSHRDQPASAAGQPAEAHSAVGG